MKTEKRPKGKSDGNEVEGREGAREIILFYFNTLNYIQKLFASQLVFKISTEFIWSQVSFQLFLWVEGWDLTVLKS